MTTGAAPTSPRRRSSAIRTRPTSTLAVGRRLGRRRGRRRPSSTRSTPTRTRRPAAGAAGSTASSRGARGASAGSASALIARSLHVLAERGMDTAVLGVDADNPSGALRLYESFGFAVHRARQAWRKPMEEVPHVIDLAPAGAPAIPGPALPALPRARTTSRPCSASTRRRTRHDGMEEVTTLEQFRLNYVDPRELRPGARPRHGRGRRRARRLRPRVLERPGRGRPLLRELRVRPSRLAPARDRRRAASAQRGSAARDRGRSTRTSHPSGSAPRASTPIPGNAALLRGDGYTPARYFYDMVAPPLDGDRSAADARRDRAATGDARPVPHDLAGVGRGVPRPLGRGGVGRGGLGAASTPTRQRGSGAVAGRLGGRRGCRRRHHHRASPRRTSCTAARGSTSSGSRCAGRGDDEGWPVRCWPARWSPRARRASRRPPSASTRTARPARPPLRVARASSPTRPSRPSASRCRSAQPSAPASTRSRVS